MKKKGSAKKKLLAAGVPAIVVVALSLFFGPTGARVAPTAGKITKQVISHTIIKQQIGQEVDGMADTGLLSLTTFATVGVGYLWASPSNAAANDGANTTLFIEQDTQGTAVLNCTGLSGISIPSGASIDGVEVQYEVLKTGASNAIKEMDISLIVGGVKSGNNLGDIPTPVTATPTVRTKGGASELWGLSLSYTDVAASNFGVMFSFREDNDADSTVAIDYVQMKIYFTVSATYGTADDITLPGMTMDATGKHLGYGGDITLPGFTAKAHGKQQS